MTSLESSRDIGETIEESEFVEQYLIEYGRSKRCRLIQIGANEGKHEYAKLTGKDFVFEFLKQNKNWEAVLVEPIPYIFERLKENYSLHEADITFLNCAISEHVEKRVFNIDGKEGKKSHLAPIGEGREKFDDTIEVQCIPYSLIQELVNWDSVDCVKIDAEGYDEHIVGQIISASEKADLPKFILWEQIGPEKENTSDKLRALGYSTYRTGRAKNGIWMDIVGIHSSVIL